MSDVISTVLELSAHPDRLDDGALEVLSDIVARHPYFDAARILYLAALKCNGSSEYGVECGKALFFLPDSDTIDRAVDKILSKREL